jgi:hypothetical protein
LPCSSTVAMWSLKSSFCSKICMILLFGYYNWLSALSNQKSAFFTTNSLRICVLWLKAHCRQLTAK